jgi:hypothetical protein
MDKYGSIVKIFRKVISLATLYSQAEVLNLTAKTSSTLKNGKKEGGGQKKGRPIIAHKNGRKCW